MKRPVYIASGASVLITTLAFGHIMYHDTVHMLLRHEEGRVFAAVHTIVAFALFVLSLLGAFLLLTSRRRENSN